MQLIVSVCRVLASRPRLRLLRSIHAQPGLTVEALAAAVALPAAGASRHLRLLANYQLVKATPQGRYVHYAPAPPRSTGQRFLRELQVYLRDMLGARQPGNVWTKLCAEAREPTWEAVFDVLLKLFTAYTHPRRLYLLRFLAGQGASTTGHLCEQLKMSAAAAHRHLHKLQRRALLAVSDVSATWVFAPPSKLSGQRRLLVSVVRALQAQGQKM